MYHTTTDGALVFNYKSTLQLIGSTMALCEPPFGVVELSRSAALDVEKVAPAASDQSSYRYRVLQERGGRCHGSCQSSSDVRRNAGLCSSRHKCLGVPVYRSSSSFYVSFLGKILPIFCERELLA